MMMPAAVSLLCRWLTEVHACRLQLDCRTRLACGLGMAWWSPGQALLRLPSMTLQRWGLPHCWHANTASTHDRVPG